MPYLNDFSISKNEIINCKKISMDEYENIKQHINQVRKYLDEILDGADIEIVPSEYRDEVQKNLNIITQLEKQSLEKEWNEESEVENNV